MRKGEKKEDSDSKKKYVFFSDPDFVVKRAENSAAAAQARQYFDLRQSLQQNLSEINIDKNHGQKSTENETLYNTLSFHPLQPYPFTFITAVKRKLALSGQPETCKKVYEPSTELDSSKKFSEPLKTNLSETLQKMDFVKPLKVPDVKISQKTINCSPRENSLKEMSSKEGSSQKIDKLKTTDRAYRKLDFSLSEETSVLSEDIEPLKAPDFCISTNLSKKKEHLRDSSRDKENRSKRIKKDDYLRDDSLQDLLKKQHKSPKHVSRKDESKKLRNDHFLLDSPRESDFLPKKSKSRNFLTSTIKKDDGGKHRSSSLKSMRESRRTSTSDSTSDRIGKLHGKISTRDGGDYKYKDDGSNVIKGVEDSKYKLQMRQQSRLNQEKLVTDVFREPKRFSERSKGSSGKTEGRACDTASEVSEDIETGAKADLSAQNPSSNRSSTIVSEDIMYNPAESSGAQSSSRELEEMSQAVASKSITDANTNSSRISNEGSSSDPLMDPRRISFRDDSYTQDEFCDLVTPDMNLMFRSKRRKQLAQSHAASEDHSNKLKKEDGVQMAELHLLDSFNESLRQVMDVEKLLHNAKHDQNKESSLQKQKLSEDTNKFVQNRSNPDLERYGALKKAEESERALEKPALNGKVANKMAISSTEQMSSSLQRKLSNSKSVPMVEVQTQTVNDIATQTDLRISRRDFQDRFAEIPGITYERGSVTNSEIAPLSPESDQPLDLDQIEDISLPSKMRTLSEISLHETTSSIKTETGTEISISTRDVTCSFNKYLDLQIAQLIQDEKQRYDKIEMLFKSREKTLNDRTKKLVKLEEQKRALRDTGQDSRISSVKKKQRALLLKLQQEKDEMNRLKELHKIASQERKLMLQKQRNMFNPQMSTKNILTKLKRSSDSQSPRRLSGPMKGYDIRSNSSMSSLVDSDKSQLERSQLEQKLMVSDSSSHKAEEKSLDASLLQKLDQSLLDKFLPLDEESNKSENQEEKSFKKSSKDIMKPKFELKSRKFEDKMPRVDVLRLKSHQLDLETKFNQCQFPKTKIADISQDIEKSESDTLVEEISKKSKLSQATKEDSMSKSIDTETVKEQIEFAADSSSKKSKSSQVSEEILQTVSRTSKKSSTDRDSSKKLQQTCSKRKGGSKAQKSGKSSSSSSNVLTENILRSKSNQVVEEFIKHPKRSKVEVEDENDENSILEELNFNESQSSLQALVRHSKAVKEKNYKLLRDIANEHEAKESVSSRKLPSKSTESKNEGGESDLQNLGNISTRSQVSTLTISHHSSGDSEKNYSRSVVIRSHDHQFKTNKKLEQILSAREAALAARKNCVEEWIAWHTRLRAEENRVARMEQAAFKLVSAASNVLSYHDSTASSDTSDVEGRIEWLSEKLAERRVEMSRLKREARKQAKQRLRALEANLLNQIKKYDTTINEMRQKLESKKGTLKDGDRLAIESKSLADFKVPEIPIKKIQEIYKSSDLLRSRSESDLILAKDKKKFAYPMECEYKSKPTLYSESITSEVSNKIGKVSSQSIQSTSEKSLSKLNDGKSERFRRKSMETISKMYTDFSDSSKHSEKQTPLSSQESILEEIPKPQSEEADGMSKDKQLDFGNDFSDNEIRTECDNAFPTFSKKLDVMQLNNKNLNDDISTLENDLKVLSEMMSRFGKRSNEKSNDGISDPKSTSKDISEDLPQSEISERLDIDVSSSKDEITEGSSKIKDGDSEEKHSLSQEIDFKAKSKEILNEIEKSIISEHIIIPEDDISVALEKSMQHLQKDNESLTHDLNTLEDDVQSISRMISKIAESKRNSITMKSVPSELESIIADLDVEIDGNKTLIEEEIVTPKSSESISLGERIPLNEVKEESLEEKQEDTFAAPVSNEIHQSGFDERDKVEELIEEASTLNSEEIQEVSPIEEVSVHSKHENEEKSEENHDTDEISVGKLSSDNDWTISDSFEAQEPGKNSVNLSNAAEEDDPKYGSHIDESNVISDMEDVSMFIPKGESTNIGLREITLKDEEVSDLEESSEKIAKTEDSKIEVEECKKSKEEEIEVEEFTNTEVSDKTDLKSASAEDSSKQSENISKDASEERETKSPEREDQSEKVLELNNLNAVETEIVITEIQSFEDEILPEIEVDAKVELVADEDAENVEEKSHEEDLEKKRVIDEVKIQECLDSIPEQESSDGEQMDNLVEVAESGLDTIEKLLPVSKAKETAETGTQISIIEEKSAKPTERIFDIIKDPEYEDISEESLEVSEILDRSESMRPNYKVKIPEKYESNQKSEDVLRILDEISQKSEEKRAAEIQQIAIAPRGDQVESLDLEKSPVPRQQLEIEEISQKQEDASSESSESVGTPRGVPEIEMDSPRDPNDSRLDIEVLDDDLLNNANTLTQTSNLKTDFHADVTSASPTEKDIEAMIDKLKASLEQPGLEVADLEAKLLRIEQLQIELEIKKLEAEEVSYYVREIPNKPPPPYTPPGGGRIATPHASPSPPPAVVPSNVEELTAFTEKATILIYNAKESGENIMNLEAPPEICELSKDNNEISKKDRKIYNTFLFDLCKEIIAEVYRSEYEKPGPSWTKPNVKTKPTMKIPKTVEELNEYVSKEVATLFGFKTKLQRENMVMRWSRKRRDRVDELLAREAQAEEDEWTKFHHDELAVKNELTLAILDTLIMETTNIVKSAYAKKRTILA